MKESPDAIVIGAGVVGAAIAYFLTRLGVHTTLVERDSPGSRVSKASFGYINAVGKRPEHYHQFSRLGVEAYSTLEGELGPDAGLGGGGALHWPAPGQEGRTAMDTRIKELDDLSYPYRLLTVPEAAELEPNVCVESIEGPILYLPIERWADGDRLALALTKQAMASGAYLVAPCSVRELVTYNGCVVGVSTHDGFLPADVVVVAAGVASVGLLAPLGYRLPLDRAIGILGVVSAPPDLVRRVLYPGVYHVRPTSGGRVAIGCRQMDIFADEDTDTTAPPKWMDQLLHLAQQDIQALHDARIEEFRVGARPVPKGGLPVIGPIPGVQGAYVAVMHSAVTLAAIVGQTVAEEIVSGENLALLEPYRPDRFADLASDAW